jgi:hypothetical protein
MILAAVLGIHLLSFNCPRRAPVVAELYLSVQQSSESTSPPQTNTSGSVQPPQASPAPAKQSSEAAPAKPSAQHHRKHKKTDSANCSDAPTALDPTALNAATPAETGPTTPDTGSAKATSQQLPPCPPPKKVVRNGGSNEPSIQLSGGTASDQAWQQQSTEQLSAATSENLKKLAGRQLTSNQQEMVNKIKEYMDQTKAAITAGDAQRGRSLAEKAHLLSEELVKP